MGGGVLMDEEFYLLFSGVILSLAVHEAPIQRKGLLYIILSAL